MCIRATVVWPFLFLIANGCAAPGANVALRQPSVLGSDEKLVGYTEDYYNASSVGVMRQSVEEALLYCPDCAAAHEIAEDLSYLENRRFDRFTHLEAALLDITSATPNYHMGLIWGLSWTLSERLRAKELFSGIAARHPRADVRSRAEYILSLMANRSGDVDSALDHALTVGWRVPLAIIGTWDSDQGKGYDISYPPEEAIDPSASYEGRQVSIAWRLDPTVSRQGYLDLNQLMHPSDWAVAYGASNFEVDDPGLFELRLSTSDPLKVWLDGELVFADRRISSWEWDNVVLPVELSEGPHTVLVKSVQSKGSWKLGVRLTRSQGVAIAPERVRPLALENTKKVVMSGPDLPAVPDVMGLIDTQLKGVHGETRRNFLTCQRASTLGLRAARAECAEGLVALNPSSLRIRFELAMSLWNNSERGRTSDLLAELMEGEASEILLMRLKQVRFWRQSDLEKKARNALVELGEDNPGKPAVQWALAELFRDEGWEEDSCFVIDAIAARWPKWPRIMRRQMSCLEFRGLEAQALEMHENLFRELPGDSGELYRIYSDALDSRLYDEAGEIALKMMTIWPERRSSWRRLAEVRRRASNFPGEREAWERLRELSPDSPDAYNGLAQMSYLEGRRQDAIALWRLALERSPDDSSLAQRLDFLDPPQTGPWADDVPDEEMIWTAIRRGADIETDPAADLLNLLDDAVVELKPDGSTVSVITDVSRVLNTSGRDSLTAYKLPSGGKTRILHSFVVDSQGNRLEAASTRGREIRFRKLDVGSTVVVQYRFDKSPDGYLGDYFTTSWWFQSLKRQVLHSRMVLWAPKSEKISEFVSGNVERKERHEGGLVRTQWRGLDIPTLKFEQFSPHFSEIAWNLQISSVPSWQLFLEWEAALLQDAFRVNPEVRELAANLFRDVEGELGKLHKIQEFLASEIRYQQDYESFIAGVKPHSAPMVLARRYGDCKDKSVLFITLARLAGIDARFALVRTRGAGLIRKEVPSQQFNHAIVYVPEQKGVEIGVFFDPTADGLDVGTLRSDDPGTWALVLDLEKKALEWKKIPFQSPRRNSGGESLELVVAPDGKAEGTVTLTVEGKIASMIRMIARNPQQFEMVMQQFVSSMLPGGQVVEITETDLESITKPAKAVMKVKAETFVRREGDELRFKLPIDANPEKLFGLDKREHDLVLDVPTDNRWEIRVVAPHGMKFKALPDPHLIESECLRYERSARMDDKTLWVLQTLTYKCERISAKSYPDYRKIVQNLRQVLSQDVVIIPSTRPKKPRRRS